MKNLLLLLFAGLLSLPCYAGYETANILIEKCNAPKDPKMSEAFSEAVCIGYVGGFMDSSAAIFGIRPAATLFCLPQKGISPEQALSHVKQWVMENPSKGATTTGRMAILISLAKAYPCR